MIQALALTALVSPLIGGLVAGLFGQDVGRKGAHSITIFGVFVAFVCANLIAYQILILHPGAVFNWDLYTWVISGDLHFPVGFLVDSLTAVMLWVVTFVSLLVHIYSIGYMANDPGYERFFAYMSAFTFAMLCLILGNGFLLLFFGWEGVGLVSYLLIGFWYQKESAAVGSFKAFLVNRVGDFGFLLGIGLVLAYFGSVQYAEVFAQAPMLGQTSIAFWGGGTILLPTAICLLLFVGAMGKSAQLPLHVWLPESMEGPTPISALIHAATMVTAGVYMVARLSPLFELSTTALNVVMVVGATGALLMGLVGLVQNDIKRVIAYSTMSQLGYMMAANGASAFDAAIFHLLTHACFKALLFLAAGSVIMGMHHEQDLMKMGGLRKHMPVTYVVFFIGACALSAVPPFAGFYSKEVIIEAVKLSTLPGATYAYVCLLLAAFATAVYIFRAFFLAFHGDERMSGDAKLHLHESPNVVLFPLIMLAIPSVVIGALLVEPFLYADQTWLSSAIHVSPALNVMGELKHHFVSVWYNILEAPTSMAFWVGLLGIATAWWFYGRVAEPAEVSHPRSGLIYRILVNKFGFDCFYEWFFLGGSRLLSRFFYQVTDLKIIDGFFVNGSAKLVGWVASGVRRLQTGYLYHYALVMIIGVVGLLVWLLVQSMKWVG